MKDLTVAHHIFVKIATVLNKVTKHLEHLIVLLHLIALS